MPLTPCGVILHGQAGGLIWGPSTEDDRLLLSPKKGGLFSPSTLYNVRAGLSLSWCGSQAILGIHRGPELRLPFGRGDEFTD